MAKKPITIITHIVLALCIILLVAAIILLLSKQVAEDAKQTILSDIESRYNIKIEFSRATVKGMTLTLDDLKIYHRNEIMDLKVLDAGTAKIKLNAPIKAKMPAIQVISIDSSQMAIMPETVAKSLLLKKNGTLGNLPFEKLVVTSKVARIFNKHMNESIRLKDVTFECSLQDENSLTYLLKASVAGEMTSVDIKGTYDAPEDKASLIAEVQNLNLSTVNEFANLKYPIESGHCNLNLAYSKDKSSVAAFSGKATINDYVTQNEKNLYNNLTGEVIFKITRNENERKWSAEKFEFASNIINGDVTGDIKTTDGEPELDLTLNFTKFPLYAWLKSQETRINWLKNVESIEQNGKCLITRHLTGSFKDLTTTGNAIFHDGRICSTQAFRFMPTFKSELNLASLEIAWGPNWEGYRTTAKVTDGLITLPDGAPLLEKINGEVSITKELIESGSLSFTYKDLPTEISGTIETKDEIGKINIVSSDNKIAVQTLSEALGITKDLHASGDVLFSYQISGTIDDLTTSVDLDMKNAEIAYDGWLRKSMGEEMNAHGSIEKEGLGYKIDDLEVVVSGIGFSGSVEVAGGEKPEIKRFKISSTDFDFEKAGKLITIPEYLKPSRKAKIEYKYGTEEKAKLGVAILAMAKVSIGYADDNMLVIEKPKLTLKYKQVEAKPPEIETEWQGYSIKIPDSPNKLLGKIRTKSNEEDMDELMWYGTFNFENLSFKRFKAENIKCNFKKDDGAFRIENLTADSYGGSVSAEEFNIEEVTHSLSGKLQWNEILLQDFLNEMYDMHGELSGDFSGKLAFQSDLSLPQFHAKGEFNVQKGQLEPGLFTSFIRKDIKWEKKIPVSFETLSADIEILDKKIETSRILLLRKGLSLELSGEGTYEVGNGIDYAITAKYDPAILRAFPLPELSKLSMTIKDKNILVFRIHGAPGDLRTEFAGTPFIAEEVEATVGGVAKTAARIITLPPRVLVELFGAIEK